MIEDNIRVLRQAARISSENDDVKIERSWCVIAGDVALIDEIAYKAIASKNKVKIVFREHVILKEDKLDKKFDFIMLYGTPFTVSTFEKVAKKCGAAFVGVTRKMIESEPNLMVLVAPEDAIIESVSAIEKLRIRFSIINESQTTGFISVDISDGVRLPGFIKSIMKPFYNANEVVLSCILISVEKETEISKVQSIATSNRIFIIDFKDIVTED